MRELGCEECLAKCRPFSTIVGYFKKISESKNRRIVSNPGKVTSCKLENATVQVRRNSKQTNK